MLPAVQETVLAHNDLLSVKNVSMRKYISPTPTKNADEKLD